MVVARALAGMALSASLGTAGCFEPAAADCTVRCGAANACPGDLRCELSTGLCRAPGTPVCDPSAATPWWNEAWPHRIPLEVKAPFLGDEQFDFPLLVRLDDPALRSLVAAEDGADLRFVSGTMLLAHEIEVFDRNAGRLMAWVRLPSLRSAPQTVHLYLGNPSPDEPLPATETWRGDYVAVYHLTKPPPAPVLDSTANGFNGLSSGLVASDDGGPLGPGLRFSPDAETRIILPTGLDLGAGPFTIEAWFSADEATEGNLVSTDVTDGERGWDLSTNPGSSESYELEFRVPRNAEQKDQIRMPEGLEPGRWYYAVATFTLDGSSALCLDDANCRARDFGLPELFDNGRALVIGADAGEQIDEVFDGVIAEVRLSLGQSSVDYVRANYEAGREGGELVEVGVAESRPE